MKWVRFEPPDRIGSGARYGQLVDNDTIVEVQGTMFEPGDPTGKRFQLADVRLLAPVVVRRVFGIGLNYVKHIKEVGAATPRIPLIFMKPDSAVIGPDAPIVYPDKNPVEVHYEAELTVVVGKRARRVSKQDALNVVFGYTCGNDVSERVVQREEMAMGSLLIGKSYDTFCPLGPYVVTGLDPSNLRLAARLNGETRQDSNTSDLLFDVPTLVSYMSEAITLEPGDVILTGTPAGIGPMFPGDVVEIDIEGIGVLRNQVVAAE